MDGIREIIINFVSVLFGFGARYYQEKKKKKKVDVKYLFFFSMFFSYVGYIVYRDYKFMWISLELWLCSCSYFGSVAIGLADDIFGEYVRTVARKVLAWTDKDNKKS